LIVLLSVLGLSACGGASNTESTTKTESTSVQTNTGSDIEVNVKDGAADDQQRVHVRAPGVQVDSDGTNNSVNVKAPFTSVQKDPNTGEVNVKAPFVDIHKDPTTGETDINVPFVHLHKHRHSRDVHVEDSQTETKVDSKSDDK
jgi:hypothetical protein